MEEKVHYNMNSQVTYQVDYFFGTAGSLVVVLLWVYFSAQILLMGAEFTCAYARTFGSHKTPDA